ncbi:uncharacterized protein BDZ99DRAFT_571452 [Mytilinidion resinicola]|uniref:Uncharacterized protein n=1 Tax=Mytilinidion resinicola TaxID=574789 RepID=A0A6A6YMB3_9PEZI|nr:uncharacterized protein BDZ99DRAFT_571452 [Mytilinidion resinicola]KAF2809678.1 hypothetical protein BDZ99DRAFT_571452 [Mytilinidion resinicola]
MTAPKKTRRFFPRFLASNENRDTRLLPVTSLSARTSLESRRPPPLSSSTNRRRSNTHAAAFTHSTRADNQALFQQASSMGDDKDPPRVKGRADPATDSPKAREDTAPPIPPIPAMYTMPSNIGSSTSEPPQRKPPAIEALSDKALPSIPPIESDERFQPDRPVPPTPDRLRKPSIASSATSDDAHPYEQFSGSDCAANEKLLSDRQGLKQTLSNLDVPPPQQRNASAPSSNYLAVPRSLFPSHSSNMLARPLQTGNGFDPPDNRITAMPRASSTANLSRSLIAGMKNLLTGTKDKDKRKTMAIPAITSPMPPQTSPKAQQFFHGTQPNRVKHLPSEFSDDEDDEDYHNMASSQKNRRSVSTNDLPGTIFKQRNKDKAIRRISPDAEALDLAGTSYGHATLADVGGSGRLLQRNLSLGHGNGKAHLPPPEFNINVPSSDPSKKGFRDSTMLDITSGPSSDSFQLNARDPTIAEMVAGSSSQPKMRGSTNRKFKMSTSPDPARPRTRDPTAPDIVVGPSPYSTPHPTRPMMGMLNPTRPHMRDPTAPDIIVGSSPYPDVAMLNAALGNLGFGAPPTCIPGPRPAFRHPGARAPLDTPKPQGIGMRPLAGLNMLPNVMEFAEPPQWYLDSRKEAVDTPKPPPESRMTSPESGVTATEEAEDSGNDYEAASNSSTLSELPGTQSTPRSAYDMSRRRGFMANQRPMSTVEEEQKRNSDSTRRSSVDLASLVAKAEHKRVKSEPMTTSPLQETTDEDEDEDDLEEGEESCAYPDRFDDPPLSAYHFFDSEGEVVAVEERALDREED